MKTWLKNKGVKSYHKALRENFEGSAPNLFSDRNLALFGVTEGVPDNLTYLVWCDEGKEPEIWSYVGLYSYKFDDLEGYLKWILEDK